VICADLLTLFIIVARVSKQPRMPGISAVWLLLLALVGGGGLIRSANSQLLVKGDHTQQPSTLAPVLIVGTKQNVGTDPDVNLPPSHDDKKTVAGTVSYL
jgi:hypothetical protein